MFCVWCNRVAYQGGSLPGGWPTRGVAHRFMFPLFCFMYCWFCVLNKPCVPLHCASGPSLLSPPSLIVECTVTPVGLLQYLRWLWCNSTEDSSEKKAPSATFPASILLAGCGPWQKPHGFLNVFCSVLFRGTDSPMEAISRQNSTNCSGWHGDFRWPGLVELCCSRKGAGLGFSSQQTVLPCGCLVGSAWPGLVKNVSSLFISFS